MMIEKKEVQRQIDALDEKLKELRKKRDSSITRFELITADIDTVAQFIMDVTDGCFGCPENGWCPPKIKEKCGIRTGKAHGWSVPGVDLNKLKHEQTVKWLQEELCDT